MAASEPIILNSAAPISTKIGWCKWGYIISLVLVAFGGVGILGLIGVFIVEHYIMGFHRDKMRKLKFKFVSGVNADEIYNKLQPQLIKKIWR